jgi:integrase
MDLVNRYSRNSAAPSWSAYRLRVLAYTGLPPGVLGKLSAIDVELAGAVVHLPARLKGDEVEARSIPLTAQGVAAFRAFAAIGAWGSFNVAGVNRAWRSAARRAGFVDERGKVSTHVYDLRHSFGTMLYRETRDLATVGRFLGHADGSKETLRYALGARRDVDIAAAALVSARFAAAIVTEQRRRAGIQVSA